MSRKYRRLTGEDDGLVEDLPSAGICTPALPQTFMSGPTSAWRAYLLAAIIAFGVLFSWIWTFLPEGHDWGGDFSGYVALARNIALGHPYADVNYVVHPDIRPQGPRAYPPVFPLILAPVYKIYGLQYAPMRVVVQALWLLAGFLLYVYARRQGFTPATAAAVPGVFLLSGMVLRMKDSVLSESTYIVISIAALLLFEHIYDGDKAARRPVLYGVLAGAVLAAACGARMVGLTLVVGFAAHELWYARQIRAFAAVAGATFVAAAILYRLTLYDGYGYSGQFFITPERIASHAVEYLKSPAGLWRALPAPVRYPAALATLIFIAVGFVRRVRARPSVAEPYVVIYLLAITIYNNTRYIVPVMPLMLLYAAGALGWAAGFAGPAVRRAALAAVGIFLVVAAALNVADEARSGPPDGPEQPQFRAAMAWIEENTGAEDVVVSWNPRVVALYSGRPSAFYQRVRGSRAELDTILRAIDAKWVLTFSRSPWDSAELLPPIVQRPHRFRRVWQTEDFSIYRIVPESMH